MNYYPNYSSQYYGNNQMRMEQYPQYMQQPQPMYKQNFNLQGKSVDNIDVVRAMDIPLDGTVSYFPLADGTAIVTKQLQQDGTSRTIIYKPVNEQEAQREVPKYVTTMDLETALKKIDNTSLKDEIKALKKQLKDLNEDFKEFSKNKEDGDDE